MPTEEKRKSKAKGQESDRKAGSIMFQEELKFFKENQDKLVEQYGGKVLVIKGNEVVGAYSTPIEAYKEASKKFAFGSFMIQPCKSGSDAYTVTISTLGLITTKV
jgi:hypothetical protein